MRLLYALNLTLILTDSMFAVISHAAKPDLLHPAPVKPKTVKHLNFFRKFFELQILMIQHNAGLTDSHPYASGPVNWPFLLSGISFWTGTGTDREQIYMIGNVVDWWFCVLALSVFVGILGAEQIARRRGIQAVPEREFMFVFLVGLNSNELIFSCIFRGSQSSVQYGRFLFDWVVLPLRSLLDYEQTALLASVSGILVR